MKGGATFVSCWLGVLRTPMPSRERPAVPPHAAAVRSQALEFFRVGRAPVVEQDQVLLKLLAVCGRHEHDAHRRMSQGETVPLASGGRLEARRVIASLLTQSAPALSRISKAGNL